MASRIKNNFDDSFDAFAGDYDEVRPGYPKDFYQDIFKICKLGRASRVIEVGVGSGIGTVELVKSGCTLVGLEPGGESGGDCREEDKELSKCGNRQNHL